MDIGATHAQRINARSPGLFAARPGTELGIDIKGALFKIDLRIGRLIMQAGWDLFVFERHYGFDQRSNARSAVEVADIGLDRADSAIAHLIGLLAIGSGERSQLNGI